jgi:hypothetical protein
MSGIIGGIKGSMKKKFVASGSGDTSWSSVSLLMTGDDLLDHSSSVKPLTNTGVTVNTSTKKFGSGALYFDGTNYMTTPSNNDFNIGTGDFTIEAWGYRTSNAATWTSILSTRANNGGISNAWVLGVHTTGYAYVYGDAAMVVTGSAGEVPLNTWVHIAASRQNGTMRLFINGTLSSSAASSGNYTVSTPCIGSNLNASEPWTGYIDDLRLTKGVARYTANFTPPTAALPISAGGVDANASMVSLLLTGDDLLDHSPSPKTVNVYGNTAVSTSTKKYGTGSIYFDGSGDYMTVASNTALQMNASDFTIECWAYISSFTGTIFELGQYTDGILLRPWGSDDFYVNGSNYGNVAQYLSVNTWTHFAVVKSGSTVTLYINGTSKITATGVGNVSVNLYGISIGVSSHQNNASQFLAGYLDDFRITKGVARYTANFTPPTAALPAISYVYSSRNSNVTEGATSNYLTNSTGITAGWGYGGSNADIITITTSGVTASLAGVTIGNNSASTNSYSFILYLISGSATNGTILASRTFTAVPFNTGAGQTLFQFTTPITLAPGTYSIGFAWPSGLSGQTYYQSSGTKTSSSITTSAGTLNITYANVTYAGGAPIGVSNGTSGAGSGQCMTLQWVY